jgi:hypothetical protein
VNERREKVRNPNQARLATGSHVKKEQRIQ